jgi:hypothetical protein
MYERGAGEEREQEREGGGKFQDEFLTGSTVIH